MSDNTCGICDGLGKLAVKRKDRTPDGSLRSVLEEVGCTNCNGTGKVPYDEVMGKFKEGKLRSGSGDKVTRRDQAIAIMLSEKRKAEAGKKEYQSAGQRLLNHVRNRKKAS